LAVAGDGGERGFGGVWFLSGRYYNVKCPLKQRPVNGRRALTSNAKKLWKNEYFQTAIAVVLILGIVFGLWYGSQVALNTKIPPALAVVSGSMCIPYDGDCDGWTHPFDRTYHIGDIIIIQGVDPQDLKTDYPDSDIIVFHNPGNPNELIVHRIAATTTIDGKLYFYTKGDGNPTDHWPDPIEPYEYDHWYNANASIPQGAVSEDLVVGKVIMRIPYLGHVALFMHDALGVNNSYIAVPLIIMLIILLIILEVVGPLLKRKPPTEQQNATPTEP
jgi:signal peptidase I